MSEMASERSLIEETPEGEPARSAEPWFETCAGLDGAGPWGNDG